MFANVGRGSVKPSSTYGADLERRVNMREDVDIQLLKQSRVCFEKPWSRHDHERVRESCSLNGGRYLQWVSLLSRVKTLG